MAADPKLVAELRARTGVSILACKEALEEANSDMDKAIEILRKRGLAQAVKKSDRDQRDGAVFISEEGGRAAVVLLKCETDFVSRGDAFRMLGQELAETLLKNGSDALREMSEKNIPEAVQKLGENISLASSELIEAPVIGTYVHSNAKIGVVIGLDPSTHSTGSGQASSGQVDDLKVKARDIAMHAAAMSPMYKSPDEVSGDAIAREKEIWKEQLAKEGKPEAIMERILSGKEKKFREEMALTTQPFVKDPSKTVEAYLAGATVTAYLRVSVL